MSPHPIIRYSNRTFSTYHSNFIDKIIDVFYDNVLLMVLVKIVSREMLK